MFTIMWPTNQMAAAVPSEGPRGLPAKTRGTRTASAGPKLKSVRMPRK